MVVVVLLAALIVAGAIWRHDRDAWPLAGPIAVLALVALLVIVVGQWVAARRRSSSSGP